jgi:bifunctional non-homologous end joining protein LigD
MTAEERHGACDAPRRFLVRRHPARTLHYDLRLEDGAVVMSWAVPKGPSLDPSARRLAIRVSDRPAGTFDFDGLAARAAAGAVDEAAWDWGSWWVESSLRDTPTALDRGELAFALLGSKLRGGFVLVKTSPRQHRHESEWLLVHRADQHAVAGWDAEEHRGAPTTPVGYQLWSPRV